MIAVGEALANEFAVTALRQDGSVIRMPSEMLWERLLCRKFAGSPFDLATYPLLFSISTLTIRRSRARSTFVLLRRSTEKVAIAWGMLSVIPTGVFQPASIMPTHDNAHFNIWRNIVPEHSDASLA